MYDWSVNGRFRQLCDTLTQVAGEEGSIIPLMRETLKDWTPEAIAEEVGTVRAVGDGIAVADGLSHAEYGEILLFSDGIRGMVQTLDQNSVGCILFGDDGAVEEGSTVRRTGKRAGMPVGEAFLGRVVNALGDPIYGFVVLLADGFRRL